VRLLIAFLVALAAVTVLGALVEGVATLPSCTAVSP